MRNYTDQYLMTQPSCGCGHGQPKDPRLQAMVQECVRDMFLSGAIGLPEPEPITIEGEGVRIVEDTNSKGRKFCRAEIDPEYVNDRDVEQVFNLIKAMSGAQLQSIMNCLVPFLASSMSGAPAACEAVVAQIGPKVMELHGTTIINPAP